MHKRLKNSFIIIDVRDKKEHESSSDIIQKCTINIPYYNIVKGIKKIKVSDNTLIILFCSTGKRSKIASILLMEQGYTNIFDLGSIDNLSYLISFPK